MSERLPSGRPGASSLHGDRGELEVTVSTVRLEELFAVADRVTVLRDGALVGTHEMSEVDRESLIRMMVGRELSAVGTGPNYLAKQVQAYAKERPDDAQVPQALYLVVRATHLGCTNIDTTKLSKAAFEFLHGHYPTSEWTARTKYYY